MSRGDQLNARFNALKAAVNAVSDSSGINWAGEWNIAQTYSMGDAVSHDGSSYLAIAESTGSEPPDAVYWQLLARGSDACDVQMYFDGTPAASQKLFGLKVATAFTLPALLTGSEFESDIAATSTYSVVVKVGSTVHFTLTWAASATVPTVTGSSPLTVNAGDKLTVVCQATPDATIAGIFITLKGALA